MSPGPGEAESRHDAFNRGARSGKVDARLEGHDAHFAAINGSLAKLAAEMANVSTGVQRLEDRFAASEKTVITTAAALKDADNARRDKETQGWSPLARWATGITVLTAAVGFVLWLVQR